MNRIPVTPQTLGAPGLDFETWETSEPILRPSHAELAP
jgi:hypothetical protein